MWCLALASALPAMVSCTEEKEHPAPAIYDRDSVSVMVSYGVNTLISDSGVIKYRIVTERWDVNQVRQPSRWTFIKGLFLEQFDEKFHVEAYIQADTAWYYDKMKLWELRGLNPSLRLRMDASEADMTWLHDKHHPAMRLRESAEARLSTDTFALGRVRPDRLMRSLFTDTAYVRRYVDARALMEQLFHVASGIQNHDFDYDLYKIFTRRECYYLWLRNNYEWYVNYGPSPLTGGRQPYTQENLLRNFILTVRPSTITAPRTLNDGSYRHTTSPLCIPAIIWFSLGCQSTEKGVFPRGNACE